MKKTLCFVFFVVVCVMLTACVKDSSIGVIGGADGPTSIIVTEKDEQKTEEDKKVEEQILHSSGKTEEKLPRKEEKPVIDNSTLVEEKEEKIVYQQITAEEAKSIMDSGEDNVILDVREQYEYDEGHIWGAILIPYTEIEKEAEKVLPDKDKQILVYCRSGRRSKIASESLSELGYTNVKEFGGIIDWPYDIVK